MPASESLAESFPEVAKYLDLVRTRKRKPNILLMVLDDAGWGDLGAYGNDLAQTPNIDRLAKEGVKFQTFHSGSAVCSPSRTCIFTGQNPARVGINTNPNRRNLEDGYNKVEYLPVDTPCLTSILSDAGYQTGFFGKAHFGLGKNAPKMAEYGVGRFFGWSCNSQDMQEYLAWKVYAGTEPWPEPMVSIHKNGRNDEIRFVDEKTTAEALKFMQAANGPWFVQLNFNTPHTPLDPRPEDREAIKGGRPYWSRSDEKVWSPDQVYYGALRSLDKRCVGPVLEWLDKTGARKDTLIIFTSDNGAMSPFNPPESGWASGYNGGYSGWKAQLDLGGVRVPCIFSWPGVFATDAVSHQLGYFADILPTIAFFAGAEIPSTAILDGENIAHALVSRVTRKRKSPIYYYYPQITSEEIREMSPTLSMLTADGEWYFQCDAPKYPLQGPYRPALYNVIADPGQTRNLYDPEGASDVGKMSRELPKMLLEWAETHLPLNWESHRTSARASKVELEESGKAVFPVY